MVKVLLTMLIILFIFPALGGRDANTKEIKNITYATYVSQEYGFYKVYEIDNGTSKTIPYNNNTLNISVGDTVLWQNDANPDTRLTIICENLFIKKLPNNYKRSAYTFNESGSYKIYIKEFPAFSQKIIVNEVDYSKISPVNNTPVVMNNTNNTLPVKISSTPKIVHNESANITNLTVPDKKLRVFPLSINNIVLFIIFISMTILGKRIEDKYCELKKGKKLN